VIDQPADPRGAPRDPAPTQPGPRRPPAPGITGRRRIAAAPAVSAPPEAEGPVILEAVEATDDGFTPHQGALLTAVRDEWTAVGFGAGTTDRAVAEAGVRLAYRSAGLAPPAWVVWLSSPLRGAVAAALLADPRLLEEADPLTRAVGHELAAQGLDLTAGDGGGRALHTKLRAELWAEVRSRMASQTTPRLRALAWTALAAPLERLIQQVLIPVRDQVVREAGERLDAELARRVRDWSLHTIYGQHDAAWLAGFDLLGRLAPHAPAVGKLSGLMQVARVAGWWWPFEQVAAVSMRPTVLAHDDQGRLHGEHGPAIAYPDGLELYRWRGMPVPADLVGRLDRLTVERIHGEQNLELRRVLTERYGLDRYLRDAGATRMAADETGVLWRLPIDGDEPLVMVVVTNSTPEPDGSRRRYWLRVPPDTRSAREAVAWTFGLAPEEYRPVRQS
jgi:hypothetical protein